MPRRNPLEKERFLEGNRQRWCAFIMGLDVIVLILTASGLIKDPTPFISGFSGLGALFILGASADSVMKIYQVGSINSTSSQEMITRTFAPKHFDDDEV